MNDTAPIVVALTGASGAIYGRRTVEALIAEGRTVDLVVSRAGRRVSREELEQADGDGVVQPTLEAWLEGHGDRVRCHDVADVGATIASGSFPCGGMIVAPCSTGTAGRIAAGVSSNLIERAADVQLKERRPLVLVVRETPLSTLHLENLTRLSRLGAVVLPAAPGFYGRPTRVDELVDFVVDRALRNVGVRATTVTRWDGGRRS